MSGFSSDWLALREPFDAAARDTALERTLAGLRHPERPLRVLDLACGTGANLRHLAPRLGGRQRWLLVDHDPALLAAVPEISARWAAGLGLELRREGGAITARGQGLECRADPLRCDIAAALGDLPFDGADLVTASALLDLVSARWLKALIGRCRKAGAAVLFTLTYDGRAAWTPAEPDDGAMRDRVNRHQRRNKGFGPALGPSAPGEARRRLAAAGYRTQTARSDWRIGARQGAVQQALATGWVEAALGVEPHERSAIQAWSEARRAHVEAGRSGVVVGHADLLAWLPARGAQRG